MNDQRKSFGPTDEQTIRWEAEYLIESEFHARTSVQWSYLPIPPTVEQMRFDGDRGL